MAQILRLLSILAISLGFLHRVFMIQIDIVSTALVAPAEDFLEQRQQPIVLKALLEIGFVLFLLHSHFI